jgi:hypothetical protein
MQPAVVVELTPLITPPQQEMLALAPEKEIHQTVAQARTDS